MIMLNAGEIPALGLPAPSDCKQVTALLSRCSGEALHSHQPRLAPQATHTCTCRTSKLKSKLSDIRNHSKWRSLAIFLEKGRKRAGVWGGEIKQIPFSSIPQHSHIHTPVPKRCNKNNHKIIKVLPLTEMTSVVRRRGDS